MPHVLTSISTRTRSNGSSSPLLLPPDDAIEILKSFAAAISSSHGVYTLDAQGKYCYVNDKFKCMLNGQSSPENFIIGTLHPLFKPIGRSESAEQHRLLQLAELMAGGSWVGKIGGENNTRIFEEEIIPEPIRNNVINYYYGFCK